MNHPINEMMSTTIQKIRDLVDANTIIGEPIVANSTITLIPISKLSIGFGTGGSDFTGKNQKQGGENSFGGGGGAAVKMTPVAFIVINGDEVKLMPMTPPPDNSVDRLVELVPDLIDKVAGFFDKKKKESDFITATEKDDTLNF
ncbi:MAG: GerW family sporulation protein [Evtepia sp.]